MSLLTCKEIVRLVTDYVEGGLDSATRARFEDHVVICPPCRAHFAQMRRTIATAGRLREVDVDPEFETAIVALFHDWRDEQAG